MRAEQFSTAVLDWFDRHGRHDLPWQQGINPYRVWVSEIMLQQTQVGRVLPKYEAFMRRFPDIETLASASLADVLSLWNGLGYNRRAKFLHESAQQIMREYSGTIPQTEAELVALPGIGKNTAGAILAYAFSQPVVFVETNIRTVFFHHFFAGHDSVDDKEVADMVELTLDREHPREWYWALMDYGTHLKSTVGGALARSRHYVKQSAFEGSRRQLRGEIIRRFVAGAFDLSDIVDERLESVIDDLVKEAFIERVGGQLRLRSAPVAAIITSDENTHR